MTERIKQREGAVLVHLKETVRSLEGEDQPTDDCYATAFQESVKSC